MIVIAIVKVHAYKQNAVHRDTEKKVQDKFPVNIERIIYECV